MSGFKVGDVVVCVDATTHRVGQKPALVHNRFYRVDGVGFTRITGRPAIGVGIREVDGGVSWFITGRFRKALPADGQFTEQMRALKPQRVPA